MPNYVRGKLQISGENVKGLIDSLCVTDKDGYKRFDFNKIVPMPDDLKICCGGPTERCMLLFINSLATGFSAYTKYVKANVTYKRGQRRLPHEKEPQIDIKVSDFEKRRMINDLLNSYSEKQPCFEENPVFKTEEDIYAYGKHALDNYLVYGYLDWYDWSIENWGTKWNACDCYVGESEIEFSTAWANVAGLMAVLSEQHPDYEFYYEYADEDTGYQVGNIRLKGGEVLDSKVYDGGSKEAYEQAFRIWGNGDDYVYDEKEGTYIYREDA